LKGKAPQETYETSMVNLGWRGERLLLGIRDGRENLNRKEDRQKDRRGSRRLALNRKLQVLNKKKCLSSGIDLRRYRWGKGGYPQRALRITSCGGRVTGDETFGRKGSEFKEQVSWNARGLSHNSKRLKLWSCPTGNSKRLAGRWGTVICISWFQNLPCG